MGRRKALSTSSEMPVAAGVCPLRRDPVVIVGLTVIVVLGMCLTVRHALKFSTPFADTHTYLEVGRNLLEGRGFVTRFNVVYGWSGELSHPGLAYYSPLYGLALGVAWQILKNPGHLAIVATVIPCLVNAVLIVLLVRSRLGRLVALLSAAGYLILPTTYHNISLITVEHPLVTVCLVLLLLVQRAVPRGRRYWILVGVVLGVGYLIKVTVFAAAPALMAGLLLTQCGGVRDRLWASIKPALLFVAGVALILVPFNLVCRITVGRWYPEYPAMAKNWSMAGLYGGEFVEDSPAIVPDVDRLPGAGHCFRIVAQNFHTMLKATINELGFLALAIVAALLGLRQTQSRDAIYLLCMGGAFLSAYATAYYWLPLAREASSPARYAIHVAPFWYPLGVAGLVHVVGKLKSGALRRGAAVIAVWLLVSLPALSALQHTQSILAEMPEPRVAGMQRTMAACRELTEPNDLIAVAGGGLMICGAMFLDRPVVALPQDYMDNEDDTRRFMEIYKPKLVIPDRCRSAWEVVPRLGYQTIKIPASPFGRAEEIVLLRKDGS